MVELQNVATLTYCFEQIKQRLGEQDESFVCELDELCAGCVKLELRAPEFDYRPDVPANGVRSFVKIIYIYTRCLEDVLKLPVTKKSKELVTSFLGLAAPFSILMKHVATVIEKEGGLETSDYLKEGHSIDRQLFEATLTLDKTFLIKYMGKGAYFWLEPSIRKVFLKGYNYLVAMQSKGTKRRVLMDRQFRNELVANFSLNARWQDLRLLWSYGEGNLNRLSLKLQYGFRPRQRMELLIPSQNEYKINRNGTVSRVSQDSNAIKPTVRCLLLNDDRPGEYAGDTVCLHIHGGAFIALSPEAHEVYLRRWAIKLKTPIVSIDYSLSPEAKYPFALQQCLDVYLFLVSKSDKVQQLLGFEPKKIIVCGDSAGGYFTIALTIALNELRALPSSVAAHIPLPSGLCVQYPVTQLVLTANSASRVLIIIDPLLPISASYAAGEAYLDTRGNDETDSTALPSTQLWFRDVETRERTIAAMLSKMDDPFYNVLGYSKFEQLKQIPLYIQAAEFDPLLDDSVALARKWKGWCCFAAASSFAACSCLAYNFLSISFLSFLNLLYSNLFSSLFQLVHCRTRHFGRCGEHYPWFSVVFERECSGQRRLRSNYREISRSNQLPT